MDRNRSSTYPRRCPHWAHSRGISADCLEEEEKESSVGNGPLLAHLFCFLNPAADSEDVSVWVPHVHLANIPRHVGRRPGDLETLIKAALVDGVDVIHPDRHPHALV